MSALNQLHGRSTLKSRNRWRHGRPSARTYRARLRAALIRPVKSSLPHREEGTDLGRRRLDLDHNGVFDGLQSVEDSFRVPADIARSHDEFLQTDGRFHFALHHVSDRFMRVGMKRGADSRRVVDLEESHLVTLNKRLDEHIATVQRLALHGTYRHSLDLGISRFDHVRLRFLPASSQKQVPGRRGQWAASIRS